MSKIRVVFLGTPDFAVTSLRGVLDDEHYEVVGVVTQPDRPSGRRMLLSPSPVKSFAQAQGIRVISPESVSKEVILQEVQKWGAEVAIVVAFGQIVSQKFLDSFPFGCVNVHASLLPKWRGAAPIQRAIEAGDEATGVVLQKMVKKLDAGDILGFRRIEIGPLMSAKDVHDQLAPLGADLLKIELMDFIRGNLAPKPQGEQGVTYAKKIEKQETELKWADSALQLHNRVRAFSMGPGAWVPFRGKKLKIHSTEVGRGDPSKEEPGTVVEVVNGNSFGGSEKSYFVVTTGSGLLKINQVQLESRNRMSAMEFFSGHHLKAGDKL